MGKQYHADTIPQPTGSGVVWTYGIDDYHAVDMLRQTAEV
jgi:hypothetical protein